MWGRVGDPSLGVCSIEAVVVGIQDSGLSGESRQKSNRSDGRGSQRSGR